MTWSTLASAGETFIRSPSALRVSSGSNKLWAIDTTGAELFSYTDTDRPDISVSLSPIGFGSVLIGSSGSQTLTVTNDGDADLIIGTITLGGTDAALFSIQNDNASGQTLTPGTSATLQVVFAPTSITYKSATLSITSNDPDESPLNVALDGVVSWPSGLAWL